LVLELVIFDCDGVLIDSETLCNRVIADDLTAQGWPITAEQAQHLFIGLSFGDTQRAAEDRMGRSLGHDWVDRMVAKVASVMALEATLIPGAREALDATMALGLPWRVASNSSFEEMDAKFARTGLMELVRGRVHSAHALVARGGRPKPAPDVFLEAAATQGVKPASCLVIEDSIAGVRAAVAAGMRCLALCHHHDGHPLRAEGATLFHSMYSLAPLLRAMQGCQSA